MDGAMGIVRDIISFLDILGDDVRQTFRDAGVGEDVIGEELGQAIRSPHVLAEIQRRTDPGRVDRAMASARDPMTYLAGLSYFSSAAHWQECGRQMLEVTPDLAAALALTDAPQGIPRNLPYDAFLISLPNTPFSYADDHGGRNPVSAVLVSVNHFHFESGWEDRIDFFPVNRGTMDIGSEKSGNHLHGSWKPGKPYDKTLVRKDTMEDGDMSTMAMMFRLIANLAVYVGERVEGEKHSAPWGNGKKKSKHRGAFATRYGSAISLPAQLVDYVRAGNEDPKFKIKSRFTVLGHWRNQPCGPGRKEVKRIWVKPHWKGPESGEQLKRIYQVSAP